MEVFTVSNSVSHDITPELSDVDMKDVTSTPLAINTSVNKVLMSPCDTSITLLTQHV